MTFEYSHSADIAFEAYSQSLFSDMAQELMLERSKRILAEGVLEQTLDDATTAFRALFRHKERITELEREVKHDTLTGLLEKTAWTEQVDTMINEGRRFGIIYIDLTNFKWVNDTISHHEGDRVLVDFAGMLLQATRAQGSEDNDVMMLDDAPNVMEDDSWVGRLGGDEFALMIDLTPRENFKLTDEQRLERVINRLSGSCKVFLENEPELRTGGFNFAIGGSVKKDVDTSIAVIKRAEKNMYKEKRRQHKQTGSNR